MSINYKTIAIQEKVGVKTGLNTDVPVEDLSRAAEGLISPAVWQLNYPSARLFTGNSVAVVDQAQLEVVKKLGRKNKEVLFEGRQFVYHEFFPGISERDQELTLGMAGYLDYLASQSHDGHPLAPLVQAIVTDSHGRPKGVLTEYLEGNTLENTRGDLDEEQNRSVQQQVHSQYSALSSLGFPHFDPDDKNVIVKMENGIPIARLIDFEPYEGDHAIVIGLTRLTLFFNSHHQQIQQVLNKWDELKNSPDLADYRTFLDQADYYFEQIRLLIQKPSYSVSLEEQGEILATTLAQINLKAFPALSDIRSEILREWGSISKAWADMSDPQNSSVDLFYTSLRHDISSSDQYQPVSTGYSH